MNELAVILGLNHDSTGYRTLRVSDDPGGSLFVSKNVKAYPALGTARSLLDQVNAGGASPTSIKPSPIGQAVGQRSAAQ